MEIDARSVNVYEGDDISITCDGSCVGEDYNPYLRWYGPDRYWIASESKRDRIYVERALSPTYRKLHIRSMKKSDEGAYICRGKLGNKIGWRLKSIILYVVPKQTHVDNSSAGRRENNFIPVTIRPTTARQRRLRTTTARITSAPQTTSPTTTSSTQPPTMETSTTTPVTSTSPSSVRGTTYSESPGTVSTASVETTTSTDSENASSCAWPDGFLCDNGDCIDTDYRCDSFPDCDNGEDEQNCNVLSCSESDVACDDNSECVSSQEICDGVKQCIDGSDEFLYKCS